MTEITQQHLEDAALAAGLRVAAGYVAAHDDLTAIALGSGMEWRSHLDGTSSDAARAAREAIVLCAAEVGRRMREANHGTT
jgi:hypothetical protein